MSARQMRHPEERRGASRSPSDHSTRTAKGGDGFRTCETGAALLGKLYNSWEGILLQRERIKRQTIARRRLQHQRQAA
jgi:hypothetical protein